MTIEYTENKEVLFADDGERMYTKVVGHLRDGNQVTVRYEGSPCLTLVYLQFFIGRLFMELPVTQIVENLKLEGIHVSDKELLQNVAENAVRQKKNSEAKVATAGLREIHPTTLNIVSFGSIQQPSGLGSSDEISEGRNMRHWTQEEIEVFDLLRKAQQACVLQTEKFKDFERLIPESLESLKEGPVKRCLENIYYSLCNLTEIKRGENPTPYPSTPVYALFAAHGDEYETCICFDASSANLHYEHMHEDYGDVRIATFPLAARGDIKERERLPFVTVDGDEPLVTFVLDFWKELTQRCPNLIKSNVGFDQPYAFSAAWETLDYYVVLDILHEGEGKIRFESFVSHEDIPVFEGEHEDFEAFFASEAFRILSSEMKK